MIKCIAIDDEPLALRQLQTFIEKTPYLQLVAACQDAFEAIKILGEEQVDAVFADINMPDLSGLDFVRSLKQPPLIVFTTAYSQYAVDGFRVNAIDYLLKPFGMPEFLQSAEKVKRQYELEHQEMQGASTSVTTDASDALFVKCDYRTVRISISQICYIESMSEYLRIHLDNGEKLMTLMAIKKVGTLLPASNFIRIHRSYLVNMNKVQEVSKMKLKMDSGTVLPIGDVYKDDVQAYVETRTIGGKS